MGRAVTADFERAKVAQQLQEAARELRAEEQAAARRRASERRLQQKVRRKAVEIGVHTRSFGMSTTTAAAAARNPSLPVVREDLAASKSGADAGISYLTRTLARGSEALGKPAEGCSSGMPLCTGCLTTLGRNPRLLLPLTANAVASASTAALRHESPMEKPLVVTATLATADRERGPTARSE
jgi:hypothetical protein